MSGLAQKLVIPAKGAGTAEGREIFPKHDELKDGDFANAVRGPLGIHRTVGVRFWFYGDYDLHPPDGLPEEREEAPRGAPGKPGRKLGQPTEPAKAESKPVRHWRIAEERREFRILGHFEARCTKEMIRASLGSQYLRGGRVLMQGCKIILGEAEIARAHPGNETEPANWKPPERRLGRRCAEFMWMFRENGLEYYKHINTRLYLILDQKGKCYRQKGDQLPT